MNLDENRLQMKDRGRREIWGYGNNNRDLNKYLPMLCQLLESNEQVMQKIFENTEKKFITLWEKKLLTLEEVSALFGIGVNRLRIFSDDNNCTFVLWNQSRRLIKREALEKYIEKAYYLKIKRNREMQNEETKR